jgi:nuclear protein localization protein 4 homolog
MLIRVRSNVGVWRVEIPNDAAATTRHVELGIAATRPHVEYLQPFSVDPAGKQLLNPSVPLAQQGIAHGSLIYCRVDPETCVDVSAPTRAATEGSSDETGAATAASSDPSKSQTMKSMRRVIDKEGRIKLVPVGAGDGPSGSGGEPDRGFRKGLLPLRDMKMSWTLSDFVALDAQYEFKIQRQASAVCQQASLDTSAVQEFQAYLAKFSFQRKRFGYLYGTFVTPEGNSNKDGGGGTADADRANAPLAPTKVRVEAIYEPPQEVDPSTAEGFVPVDDPKEQVVEDIAKMLGLQRVGWIFGGHEAREPGYVLSGAEILMAAELQLEAADGVNETPFVTVKVAAGRDGTVSVEAFQVSQQCMAMVAEQALELNADPKVLGVNETFTAIQEGKASKTIENNFFLCVVPIVQHSSDLFVSDFPKLNRDVDDRFPSVDEMRKQLQKSGSSGWTFEDRLADFNLLVFLSDYLDVQADFPKICSAIVNKQPLDDGYKLILKSLAGMEGSY